MPITRPPWQQNRTLTGQQNRTFDYNGDPAAGYDEQQFNQWYGAQYGGAAPSEQLRQQIGGAVGTPGGPNGRYNQAQWQQAQTLAGQQGAAGNATPFFPEFTAPQYQQGPAYDAGPAYDPGAAYQAPEAFRAPTMDEAQQDPGYQMALKQGLGAMQGAQAAKGLARTGGALKGLMDYGQQSAEQQYGNVYNRAAGQYAQNYQQGRDAWSMNQQQRAQAYGMNQQQRQGEWDRNQAAREGGYDRQYRGASDAFNANFRGRELQFEDLYRRWNTSANINAQMALAD